MEISYLISRNLISLEIISLEKWFIFFWSNYFLLVVYQWMYKFSLVSTFPSNPRVIAFLGSYKRNKDLSFTISQGYHQIFFEYASYKLLLVKSCSLEKDKLENFQNFWNTIIYLFLKVQLEIFLVIRLFVFIILSWWDMDYLSLS